jgi:hypothetical protein
MRHAVFITSKKSMLLRSNLLAVANFIRVISVMLSQWGMRLKRGQRVSLARTRFTVANAEKRWRLATILKKGNVPIVAHALTPDALDTIIFILMCERPDAFGDWPL